VTGHLEVGKGLERIGRIISCLIGGVEDNQKTLWISGLLFEIRTLNLLNMMKKFPPFFFSDRDVQWKNISMPSIEERFRD
jgi:hypothetical protein